MNEADGRVASRTDSVCVFVYECSRLVPTYPAVTCSRLANNSPIHDSSQWRRSVVEICVSLDSFPSTMQRVFGAVGAASSPASNIITQHFDKTAFQLKY